MANYNIVALDFTITSLIISICVAIIAGVIVYYKLEKKHKVRINELQYDVSCLRERLFWLEQEYTKHIHKYH